MVTLVHLYRGRASAHRVQGLVRSQHGRYSYSGMWLIDGLLLHVRQPRSLGGSLLLLVADCNAGAGPK